MPSPRPYLLSIAGFDPSAGAGVLADVKTSEANKVYGLGAVSALTYQNESEFDEVKWISENDIKRQVEVLYRKHKFGVVKIGLIENLGVMNNLTGFLLSMDPQMKIIWDPVLKASAGFELHDTIDHAAVRKACKNIFMLTPNLEEIKKLTGTTNEEEGARSLSAHCHVYLKGGHDERKKGRDRLFRKDGKHFSFNPQGKAFDKHGSGCVLSAAIAANLARGFKLHPACLKSKRYTEKFLGSNKGLLGYHKL